MCSKAFESSEDSDGRHKAALLTSSTKRRKSDTAPVGIRSADEQKLNAQFLIHHLHSHNAGYSGSGTS